MINTVNNYLQQADPEIAALVELELRRQQRNLELIASENVVSLPVLAAAGSQLTNKYAEGLPGKRYYGGCEYVDQVEEIAIERAKQVFGVKYVNVQPHSGAQANFAAYQALVQPGDTVLGMSLDNGGHLTHGSRANFSGKNYNIVSYGVHPVTHTIDYDEVRRLAKEHQPRMIVCGASAYPRTIDFAKFAEIAHEVGAYLFVDMAHIAGLVAAGVHPSPVGYADVITCTTHKTMRGPRGGLIMTNDDALAKKINSAVFPGSQGGPLMHIIAAKAVALKEALQPEFKTYQQQVVKNCKALAASVLENGLDLVSGGTDNHLILVDLRPNNMTGVEMQQRLESVNITTNKNAIPNDPEKPTITSGIRVGTPAATARGLMEDDFTVVGRLICEASRPDFEQNKARIIEEVAAITNKYPLYE